MKKVINQKEFQKLYGAYERKEITKSEMAKRLGITMPTLRK